MTDRVHSGSGQIQPTVSFAGSWSSLFVPRALYSLRSFWCQLTIDIWQGLGNPKLSTILLRRGEETPNLPFPTTAKNDLLPEQVK